MTVDEMVEQALGRLGEFGAAYPSARGPVYRRIGMRQRQLFAQAGKLNPDRFGAIVIGNMQTVNGMRVLDLSDIEPPLEEPELIQRVEIIVEQGPYEVGQQVTIVSVADFGAELPPRAIIRDRVLYGLAGELDFVDAVRLYYTKLPALIGLSDKAVELALEAPWDTLLEIDAAKWMIAKATQVSAETRAAALASLSAEETVLHADFLSHVAAYAPTVSRFAPHRILGA